MKPFYYENVFQPHFPALLHSYHLIVCVALLGQTWIPPDNLWGPMHLFLPVTSKHSAALLVPPVTDQDCLTGKVSPTSYFAGNRFLEAGWCKYWVIGWYTWGDSLQLLRSIYSTCLCQRVCSAYLRCARVCVCSAYLKSVWYVHIPRDNIKDEK